MKKPILVIAAAALLSLSPLLSVADSWKDESGHGRHHDEHRHTHHDKHKHKHKRKDDHEHEHRHEHHAYEHDHEVEYVEYETVEYETVEYESVEPSVADVGIQRGTCNRDAIGAVLGGVVGGVIGNKIGKNNGNQAIGTVAGAIAGVLIGNQIGKNMDEHDKQCTLQTLAQAKNGQTVTWHNPDNGLSYEMTPVKTYQKENQTCRTYVTVVSAGEKNEEFKREACRQPEGHWVETGVPARM